MFPVEITFCGDVSVFLSAALRSTNRVHRVLGQKTAVKDVIEACGVPHPEIDLILVTEERGGMPKTIDFSWPVQGPAKLEVHLAPSPPELLPACRRLQLRRWDRFVADGHLGKLARNLRLLGIDTAYERDADDRRLLEVMTAENRAL